MNRELSNSDENPTTGKLASVPDDTSGADQDTPSFPSDSTQYALRGASSKTEEHAIRKITRRRTNW